MRAAPILLMLHWIGTPLISAYVVIVGHRRPTSVTSSFLAAVSLKSEPEGGEELTAFKSMPDCRMKKMKEIDNKKSDGRVYEFWLTAVADGVLVKSIRSQILKDASKKANFPGFRKVSTEWSMSICSRCFTLHAT